MNRFRKQIFVSSICSSLILFIFGVTLLVFINKSDSQATGKLSNMLKLNEYTPLKEPINILLMGGDKSNGITDTIMVVNYNPKNSQISMLSIPRDTRAVYNRKNVKINSIYSTSGKGDYGCESLKGSVNNLLGIKIDYYVYIDVLVFRAVVDELGGVEYDVPCRMYYSDPSQNLHIDLKKGKQTLDGESAEGLVRFRKRADNVKYSAEELADYNKVYNGSDLKRMDVQQNFIKEVIKQKASMATLNKINDILAIVFKRLSTNITAKTTIQIGTNLGNMSSDKIKNFKIHVVDTTDGSGDVLYTENITDNTSKKNYPSKEILEKYFSSNASDWKNEISEIATAEPTENTTTIEPVENQIATKAPVITEAPIVEPTATPEIVPTPTKTKKTFIIKTPTPTPVVEPTVSPVETNTDIPISW